MCLQLVLLILFILLHCIYPFSVSVLPITTYSRLYTDPNYDVLIMFKCSYICINMFIHILTMHICKPGRKCKTQTTSEKRVKIAKKLRKKRTSSETLYNHSIDKVSSVNLISSSNKGFFATWGSDKWSSYLAKIKL